jgi:hypothetical protein
MLRQIGVKAEPVLINSNYNPDLDIVTMNHFNHMIVYLPEQEIYLDPTSDITRYVNLPPQDQGKNVYFPLTNTIKQTPISPISKNKENITQIININENNTTKIIIQQEYTGYLDAIMKNNLNDLNQSQRETYLKNTINQNYFNASLDSYNITGVGNLENDTQIQMKLSTDNYLEQIGNKFTRIL